MYILTEQIMNGTATEQIVLTGIDTENFKEAIGKVKNMCNFGAATICSETDSEFSYTIGGPFGCFGRMENKLLQII